MCCKYIRVVSPPTLLSTSALLKRFPFTPRAPLHLRFLQNFSRFTCVILSCHIVILSCHLVMSHRHVILSYTYTHYIIHILTNLIRIHLDNIYVTTKQQRSLQLHKSIHICKLNYNCEHSESVV